MALPFSLFSIALKNLVRRPARSAAMALGIAALSFTLLVLSALYLSVERGVEQGGFRLGADAMVVPDGLGAGSEGILLSGVPAALYMDAGLTEKLRAMEGVEAAAAQLFIVSARLACCSVSDTVLVGFEPERDFTVTPWLREKLKRPLASDEIIAGGNILSEPGGRIQFYGQLFTIAGKLEPTGMKFMDSSVFIPMEGARRMIALSGEKAGRALDIGLDEISAVMLRFAAGADHEEEGVKIEYAFPGTRVILAHDALRAARRDLLAPVKSTAAALVLQWAVGLVLVGVLYGLSLEERRRETGLMRAMGAKDRHVLRILLYEVLIFSGAGGAIGAVSGVSFLFLFQDILGVFFAVPSLMPSFPRLLPLAVSVVAFSVLAGLAAVAIPLFKGVKHLLFPAPGGR